MGALAHAHARTYTHALCGQEAGSPGRPPGAGARPDRPCPWPVGGPRSRVGPARECLAVTSHGGSPGRNRACTTQTTHCRLLSDARVLPRLDGSRPGLTGFDPGGVGWTPMAQGFGTGRVV